MHESLVISGASILGLNLAYLGWVIWRWGRIDDEKTTSTRKRDPSIR